MSIIDALVTDRVVPGQYDWRDFNRVETAVAYISSALEDYGYAAPVTVKTWGRDDKISLADAERYAKNIQTLRAAIAVFKTTPPAPSTIRFLTYETANDIEKILYDISMIIKAASRIFIHAGMKTAIAMDYPLYFAN